MLCVLGASALLMGAAAIHQIQLPDTAGSPDAAEVLCRFAKVLCPDAEIQVEII